MVTGVNVLAGTPHDVTGTHRLFPQQEPRDATLRATRPKEPRLAWYNEAEGAMGIRGQDCGKEPGTDGQNPYSHASLPAVGSNAPWAEQPTP